MPVSFRLSEKKRAGLIKYEKRQAEGYLLGLPF